MDKQSGGASENADSEYFAQRKLRYGAVFHLLFANQRRLRQRVSEHASRENFQYTHHAYWRY